MTGTASFRDALAEFIETTPDPVQILQAFSLTPASSKWRIDLAAKNAVLRGIRRMRSFGGNSFVWQERAALLPITTFFLIFLLLVMPTAIAQQQQPAFVGSSACATCHAGEFKAWQGTHHALAWTQPAPDTVFGDFSDKVFSHKGVDSRFFTEGKNYFIETQGGDGKQTRFPVVGVAGVAPLQQYLLDTGNGHIQSFDVVWDILEKRWYHLYPDQDLPPGDGLHWTGPYKNWNGRCAECHATGFRKNYAPLTRSYQSTTAEIGVGCESCHGPASEHVAWANGKTGQASGSGMQLDEKGLVVAYSAAEPATELEVCAGCHSRRENFYDTDPLAGRPFDDAHRLSLLSPGLYFSDGQMLDEVYNHGSFLQSKMHAAGVRCSDCHDPHEAKLKADGEAVCTQCHSPAGNDRFPTLAKKLYDDPSHHFHEAGTEGAQCKNCHMGERVYMGIDWRHDHNFRVPRPDLSVETGNPDTCTDCHKDRTAQWAADAIASRFPESTHRGPHFSQVMFKARQDPAGLALPLMELAEHDGMPDIVRASALELLQGTDNPEVIERSAKLLSDDSALVRSAAAAIQRSAGPGAKAMRLSPLLRDELRSVRMAAARELLGVPPDGMSAEDRQTLGKALDEWRDSLMARADFPETHLVLGGIYLTVRNFEAAAVAFGEAVRLDPQRADAWSMIVRINEALGRRDEAKVALAQALKANPGNAELRELEAQLR
jgi:predicted CXXCH cytochrome family protein